MFGQILIYAIISATQVLFVALALYAIRLVSRSINLALGGIATAVAYAFYFGFIQMRWPLALAILAAVFIAMILGAVNYWINEPLTRRGQHLYILITSFATGLALEALVAIFFSSAGKSLIQGIVPSLALGRYQIPLPGLTIIVGGLLIAALVWWLYRFTPLGRILRAIAENNFTAMSIGINQSRFRLLVYIFSALMVGAIGILSGLHTAIVPTMGFNLLVFGFIAFLVGGVTDLKGTVVASFVLVIIPELITGLTPSVSANWRLLFVFAIACVLLLVRPFGLFAKARRII